MIKFKNKGQAMLLAVLLVGTSVLVITSLSGYLMLQRIRMGFNFVDSTKAIFAADAGVECEFYNSFKGASVDCDGLTFSDLLTKVQTVIISSDTGVPQYIKSIGTSNKSNRAFVAEFKVVAPPAPPAPPAAQYQCPLTGTAYSDQSSCNSVCKETASCYSTCDARRCYVRNDSGFECRLPGREIPSSCTAGIVECPSGSGSALGLPDKCPSQDGESASGCFVAYSSYTDCSGYSCPISGGSACSGSPQTCAKDTACVAI